MQENDELTRFLERVVSLTDGELLAIIAAGNRDNRPGRSLARRRAEHAAGQAGLVDDLDRARDRIIAWATSLGPDTGQLPGFAFPETLDGDLRRRAAPEIINAAIAIALGDRIPPDVAGPLLSAWRSVVEPGSGPDRVR